MLPSCRRSCHVPLYRLAEVNAKASKYLYFDSVSTFERKHFSSRLSRSRSRPFSVTRETQELHLQNTECPAQCLDEFHTQLRLAPSTHDLSTPRLPIQMLPVTCSPLYRQPQACKHSPYPRPRLMEYRRSKAVPAPICERSTFREPVQDDVQLA